MLRLSKCYFLLGNGQSSILDEVISRIEPALGDTSLFCITLTASPQAIQEHLQKDIDAQLREEDIIEHSLARLALYDKLSLIHI